MKILAIDPGPEFSAYVIWDGSTVLEKAIVPTPDLLGYQWRCDHIGFGFDACCIEMIASYGMAVGREVFETCTWIGRYQERWLTFSGIPAHLIYRKDIKLHHCHSPRANDSNIRTALVDRFGKPGTKKQQGITYGISKDLWSALAIATYYYDKHCGEVAA